MYSESSTNLNNYIEQLGGRTFVAKLECSSFSIESGIKSIRYNGGSNSEQGITIGSTVSANIEVTMSNTEHMLTGQEISLFLGAEINGALEYIPMGIFKANKPNSTDYDITFTAHDRMASADKVYSSKLTYPTTSDKVMNEIANILGVQFIGTIEPITLTNPNTDENASNTVLAGYTIREAIGFMAALYGKFAIFNRFGQLEFRWYEDNGYELPMSKTYSFDKTDSYTIDKVVGIAPDDTKYQSGSGTQGILFSSQFLTKNTVDEIYNSIGGFTYNGSNVTFLGDCRLDPWDIVTYTDLSGSVYKIPLMSISHDIDGGLTTTISAFVDSSEDISDKYSGPVTKAMERTHAELLLVNQLLATKITAEEVDANYVRTDELDAISATIESAVITNLQGQFATIEEIKATYATIAQLNATDARIESLEANALTANSAYIKELEAMVTKTDTLIFGSASGNVIQTSFSNSVIAQLGDAQIESAMIKELSADKITGLDLNTTKFTVHSEDGKSTWKDNTIQISDGSRVRVQIGKDAESDYNMYVWDKTGALMFDALGLTADGITRQIIRDDVVMDNANISATKLNIESLFNALNEDGSYTLKSSKIYVDADGQTLDVAFQNMTTTVSNLESVQTSQGTQISTIQGQIASKIWQQDISGAISGIEIGGRNLVLNSGRWNDTECPIADTSYNVNVDNLVIGEEYTVSFEIKSTENYTGNTAVVQFYNELDERFQVEWVVTDITTEYKKASYTFVIPENTSYVRIGLRSAVNRVNTYRYLQVEEGNMATSYKVAPEDTDGQIATLNTQYSEISQDIDGISAIVASHTTQIANKAENSTVTAVQNQVSTLSLSLDEFQTTVSSTYTTKEEFDALDIGAANILRYMNAYTSDNKYAVTATKDNFYVATAGRVHLTAGRTYTFSCDTDGVWQSASSGDTVEAFLLKDNAYTTYFNISTNPYTFTVEVSGYYTLRLDVNQNGATHSFWNIQIERGNKATDWKQNLYDTEEEITSVRTIATQNADKFNWIVESGTSSTDFTLTDRMAELTASIISLNGDVKVSGDMLVDGAVTAEKISVSDLYALGATIGGLTVDTDKLYMGDAGMSSHHYYYAFWAGETNGANGFYAASTGTSDAKFRVSHNGKLYASDAEIEGKITTSRLNATGGVINLNASSNTSSNKYTYMEVHSSNNDYVTVSSLLNHGGQIDLYSSLHHMYITPAYIVGRKSDGSQGFQLNGSGGYLDISNYIQTEGYIKADGLIKSSSGFSVNPNSSMDIGMYYANNTVSIKSYYGSIALQTADSVHCVNYANSTNVPIYASAFTQKSSKRYKAHLGYMSEEEADRLLSLDVVKFDYINGAKGQYGLYAEDTYTHIPTCVYSENGVIEGIDYTKLIPFIIKKLQMQNKHIEELDNLVNHLIGIAMT